MMPFVQPLDDQHFHKDSRNLLDQHDLNWLKSHQVPTTNVSAVFQYAKKEDKYGKLCELVLLVFM